MGAFGWAVKDCWVLGGLDLDDFVLLGYQSQLGHAVGAGEMVLPRDHGGVGYDGRLVEYLFASFVGAFEFLLVVPMEKLHAISLPCLFNIEYSNI